MHRDAGRNAIVKRFANILALLNKYMPSGNCTLVEFMAAKVKTKATPKNAVHVRRGENR